MIYFKYFIVFLIGFTFALAELLSRYDRLGQIFHYLSSWIYFLINGFTSVFGYWLLTEFKIDLGPLTANDSGRILLAGGSSMIILRSSFASLKIGDSNFEAGFASITNIFLKAADRTFDQKRSISDYNKIKEIMKNVDFELLKIDLPITCLNVMKNVPSDEQKLLGDEVNRISIDTQSNFTKSVNLGILVAKTTGIDLLRTVVTALVHEGKTQLEERYTLQSDREEKIKQLLERLK
ncbi:MAG: hypothetical protein JEZ11_05225 [Desulfobacterales bacterium]|nr:hypothetical protein [Desulfobacterales bacterium]